MIALGPSSNQRAAPQVPIALSHLSSSHLLLIPFLFSSHSSSHLIFLLISFFLSSHLIFHLTCIFHPSSHLNHLFLFSSKSHSFIFSSLKELLALFITFLPISFCLHSISFIPLFSFSYFISLLISLLIFLLILLFIR